MQTDENYEYLVTPPEYPISDNNMNIIYDQFIKLRDTLVYSNKYYADSAGRSLIIWTKLSWEPTWTIEIWTPNMVRQVFEPNWGISLKNLGNYVEIWWHTSINPLSCEIKKDWRYKLQHKEQFIHLDNTTITRIHTYILQHKPDWTDIERAVYDFEWINAWDMIRIPSFGYVECDLNKDDWLELKLVDQNDNDIPFSQLQTNSNRRTVEYIDLIYN